MKWLYRRWRKFPEKGQREASVPYELERLLDEQIGKADFFGAFATARRLGRAFFPEERVRLVTGCLGRMRFAEAFLVARDFPPGTQKSSLLQAIARGAAFEGDLYTAWNAARLLKGNRDR